MGHIRGASGPLVVRGPNVAHHSVIKPNIQNNIIIANIAIYIPVEYTKLKISKFLRCRLP